MVEIKITPPVTVLIPCNNIEYLRECLTSIEKQEYSNLKVLVVLNGPVSNLMKQLQNDFSSMSIPVEFLSTPLDGIVNALNFGLENCHSELIARIDADDLMPPSRIISQVSEFQKDSELVCVGGQLEYLNTFGLTRHPGYPRKHDEICHALHRYSSLAHPGVMYRKSALIKIGNYIDEYPVIEDWNLWVRLSEIGKIVNLPSTTVFYRIHANQITDTKSTTQYRSIIAFSFSRLRECLLRPQRIELHKNNPNSTKFLCKMMTYLFFRIKPTYKNGMFGRKEIRRRLAGYLYLALKYSNIGLSSPRFRKSLFFVAIALIDPRLLLVSSKNLFLKIT